MSKLGYALDFARYWALDRIPPKPRVLRVEITNRCNLQCTICDRSAMTRSTEAMDWELYQKIVADAVDWGIPQIGLNRFGEPMLHPRLPEMIAFAKDRGARFVEFVTNGTLLDEKRGRAILEAGIDQVAISVDGHKKETYESIRVGASHAEVMDNVQRFIELRDKIRPQARIQMNFVCTAQTFDEAPAFHRHWRDKVDSIYYIPFMGYAGLKNQSNLKRPKGRAKCYMLWYMLVAATDGKAGVCCHGDPNRVLDVGDLSRLSLKEVWTGPEVERIRRVHIEKRWRDLPICAACDLTFPYTYWAKHYLATYRRVYFGRRGSE